MNRVKFVGIVVMMTMIGLTMTACNQPNDLGIQVQQWTVSFIRNHTDTDNATVTSFTHTDGDQLPASVTIPTARANYTFTGYWTARTGGTQYFNASGARTAAGGGSRTLLNDLRLYAQWYEGEGPPNGGPPQEGQIPANLVGTWLAEYDMLVLNANGTFGWTFGEGTASVSGNNITLTFTDQEPQTGTFSQVGNTLTLFIWDQQFVFTRQITWTATPVGSPTTTAISFTFSADPGLLEAEDILISPGYGSAEAGDLTGTGTMRTLSIYGVVAGDVSIHIFRAGVAYGPQTVALVVPEITWTATPVGYPITTSISIAFSADPGLLEVGDITITPVSGSAEGVDLTGSGATRILTLKNVSVGDVSVYIHRVGIAQGPQTVTLARPEITWTATLIGDPVTTSVRLDFSAATSGWLDTQSIAIVSMTGSAYVSQVLQDGYESSHIEVVLGNVGGGDVSISINMAGVSRAPQTVTLVGPTFINWTARQAAGFIMFDFESDPGSLSASSFTITSATGSASLGWILYGTGTTRALPISGISAGDVSVSINSTGVIRGPRTVGLVVPPTVITWTATPVGNTVTTSIDFTFSTDPGWLEAEDITIASGVGMAIRGALSGTGNTRSLAVTGVRAGDVSVSISRSGIASASQPVTLVAPAITWTPTPVGNPVTTSIRLDFDATPPNLGWEWAQHVMITSVTGSAFVSSAGQWPSYVMVHLRDVGGGDIVVSIDKAGIDSAPQMVTLAGPAFINWTAEQSGSFIMFEFESDPGSMTASNFTIADGTGSATRGWDLSGTGTTRALEVSGVIAGSVSVSIDRIGVMRGPQTVSLVAPAEVTWSATPVGNLVTTSIRLDFSANPGLLEANDFTIVSVTGSAVVTDVSQWPNAELSLSNVGGGDVLVSINRAGVSGEPRPVTLLGPAFINWTAEQAGSFLMFEFESDPGTLSAYNFVITEGTGWAAAGWILHGTGTTRVLPIGVSIAGSVSVVITRDGIVRGPKTVNVVMPTDITWTATPVGYPLTTSIDFAFSENPGWLEATDITIASAGGAATRGTLSGTGNTRSLTVTDVRAGDVSVSIDRTGIVPGPQTVTLIVPPLTGSVTITGTTQAGSTLTANTANLGGSGTIFFQWRMGNHNITNATGSSLNLTAAHVNQMITVVVERANNSGSITSPAVGPVTPAPQLTGTVTIQGTPQVNVQLTAITTGLIGGSGANSFQWMAGNTPVGTNSSTFTPAATHVNQMITVVVTRAGHTGSVTSPAVGPVQAAAPPANIAWAANPTLGNPTPSININFLGTVPAGLVASDITIIPGTGSATRGALTGTGTTRTLAISGVTGGTVTIMINRAGIAPGPSLPITLLGPPPVGDNPTITVTGIPAVHNERTAQIFLGDGSQASQGGTITSGTVTVGFPGGIVAGNYTVELQIFVPGTGFIIFRTGLRAVSETSTTIPWTEFSSFP